MVAGRLILIEGMIGAGKSTTAAQLAKWLASQAPQNGIDARSRARGISRCMRLSLVVLMTVLVARAAAAVPACTANDIEAVDPGCPAQGPCTITRDIEIAGSCTLDFATRPVSIGQDRKIRIAPAGGLTIMAGSFTMLPGAFIDGRGQEFTAPGNQGASLTVITTGDVVLQQIDLSGVVGAGAVSIKSGANVNIGGRLTARGLSATGLGGPVDIGAAGDLVTAMGSAIDLSSGGRSISAPTEVHISVSGKVDLGDAIDVSGRWGGMVDIRALGGDLIVRGVRASGSSGDGSTEYSAGPGGELHLYADGSVYSLGPISLHGGAAAGANPYPGFGGHLDISAGGAFWNAAPISVDGGRTSAAYGPEGQAGTIEIFVNGAITLAAGGRIYARSSGTGEGNGDYTVNMRAGSSITTAARIDTSGVNYGGNIRLDAGTDVAVRAPIDASASGAPDEFYFGGTIDIYARSDGIRSGALLIAAAVSSNDSFFTLEGCDVTVTKTGLLTISGSQGNEGEINITTHKEMRIDGAIMAVGYRSPDNDPPFDGHISIQFPEGHLPVFGNHSVVRPAPELVPGGDVGDLGPCPSCGNGIVEGNEACDDGNQTDCDGCDSNCTLSSTCGNGIRCGAEQCDAPTGTPNAGCCDATCHNQAAHTPCDDGELCTNGDVCDAAGVCAGSATPLPAMQCRQAAPGRAFLQMIDGSPDDTDQVSWRWERGPLTPIADFGEPQASTSYAFCVYDQSATSRLRMATDVSAGGLCRPAKPCWKSTGNGFRYATRTALQSASGVTQISLVTGADHQARLALRGKGAALSLPTLPFTPPVTVQLRNSAGACWGATYSTFLENDLLEYHAKSD